VNELQYIKLFFKNKKSIVGVILVLLFIVMAVFAPYIAPYSPTYMGFAPFQNPSLKHLLGTTSLGQDIFSQVIWGARISLFVGIVTGLISTMLSVIIGLSAGYLGGLTDDILMTITNILLVIPGLPLVIIISAFVPVRGTWTIILILSATGWTFGARGLRSQMLSLKNMDYVKSSIVTGENAFHIIFSDITPNMSSLIVAHFFGATIGAILGEAGLEFLGLGNMSAISWGTILYWAQSSSALTFGLWEWAAVPGLLIALLGMSFALMNFAVDEITNPKLRKR